MRPYLIYAALAGVAWGLGGYYEKLGLKSLQLAPIAGITLRTAVALALLGLLSIPYWKNISMSAGLSPWLMIIFGGGVVAGTLGMWSFYASLAATDNLGITLAVAFALSPLTGTVVGLFSGDQEFNAPTAFGLLAIIAGIVLVQTGRGG
jgi:transporter family protein